MKWALDGYNTTEGRRGSQRMFALVLPVYEGVSDSRAYDIIARAELHLQILNFEDGMPNSDMPPKGRE